MDLFGEQMLLLQRKMARNPPQDRDDTIMDAATAKESPETPNVTTHNQDTNDDDTTWDENFAASQSEFDDIMTKRIPRND